MNHINFIKRDWCKNGKCSECKEGCLLDEKIPCSPDCENLTNDGYILVSKCLESGCDAIKSVFGSDDLNYIKNTFAPKNEYPFADVIADTVDELNREVRLKEYAEMLTR